MDLVQLEMFRAVAQHQSVVAAARAIHRVPSNLTTRIKQLEADLGTELFIRENNRLRLSANGQAFLRYATQILDLVDQARAAVAGDEPVGWFPLGSLESTAAVRLPGVLSTYNRNYPNVDLDLSTGPSGEMLDGVLNGRLVGAFVDGPVAHPALEGMPLFDEEMVVIAPAAHPPILRGADVSGALIYVFRQNCSYRRHFERWFAEDGVSPGRVRELESYHGILACVSAGSGLAIMPRSMLESMPGSQAVSVWPMNEAFRFLTIWLVWRKDAASRCLDALVEQLRSGSEGIGNGRGPLSAARLPEWSPGASPDAVADSHPPHSAG